MMKILKIILSGYYRLKSKIKFYVNGQKIVKYYENKGEKYMLYILLIL